MSKTITFSRTFPTYHPRDGEPTYFVEKIWKFIYDNEKSSYNPLGPYQETYDNIIHPNGDGITNIHNYLPKKHTIRSGTRFKVGDKFSPRVWSGKPYRSKQITIADDIEIKKIYDFEINPCSIWMLHDNNGFSDLLFKEQLFEIAKNDGLSFEDFYYWFLHIPFYGQVICWDDQIKYI